VVLTVQEAHAVLQRMSGVTREMAVLMYSADLRLLERARLRIKDVDFARNQITVRSSSSCAVIRDSDKYVDRAYFLSQVGVARWRPPLVHQRAKPDSHYSITLFGGVR
jgi:site-specific recombinase XerC